MKKLLAPKSKEMPHAILDNHENLITDPVVIRNEYKAEFQYRLRKRDIRSGLEWFENFQNRLCKLRVKTASEIQSPDFTFSEVKEVISKLKTGKSTDPTGFIRELYNCAGDGLLLSILEMMNAIKKSKYIPDEWNTMWIRTLKKKKGTSKKLDNYRGIFIVPILSIIFEKLLKNRLSNTLEENISKFQNGGMKGKGVLDNLFIIRGIINHAKYLGKELWLTFYDIEKCFDSLWLEDCINSLWDMGVRNDILSLIYLMNKEARVTVKTPVGDTDPILLTNLVKQGTVLGPVLNNCSLNKMSTHSTGYNFGSVQLKPLEFVDDIADPSREKASAIASNSVLEAIQHEKRISFSAEKCELLKINCNNSDGFKVNGIGIKVVESARYLGDLFNIKGDNSDICRERHLKAEGTSVELCSLSRGLSFGIRQIESMLILYKTVFVPRLIYNCEAWSKLKAADYKILQSAQLKFMRKILEVPRSTPTAALYLELGIWPIRYEIEIRQLFFLKRVLNKTADDPCLQVYFEMLKFKDEPNLGK